MINNWNGNQEEGSNHAFRRFPHKLAALVILLIIALTSLGVIGSDLYTVGVSQVGILVNPYTGDFSGACCRTNSGMEKRSMDQRCHSLDLGTNHSDGGSGQQHQCLDP